MNDIPPSRAIYGPYTNALDNDKDTIELLMPGSPEANFVPYIVTEKLATATAVTQALIHGLMNQIHLKGIPCRGYRMMYILTALSIGLGPQSHQILKTNPISDLLKVILACIFTGWEMVTCKKHPIYQVLGSMSLIGQAHIL